MHSKVFVSLSSHTSDLTEYKCNDLVLNRVTVDSLKGMRDIA